MIAHRVDGPDAVTDRVGVAQTEQPAAKAGARAASPPLSQSVSVAGTTVASDYLAR